MSFVLEVKEALEVIEAVRQLIPVLKALREELQPLVDATKDDVEAEVKGE